MAYLKLKNTIGRDRTSVRSRYGRDVGLSDREFKTAMINRLRALLEKVGNMQQMSNAIREIKTLRNNLKKNSRDKNQSSLEVFLESRQYQSKASDTEIQILLIYLGK